MILKCEQCQTRFKIPDDKVTEKGVRVRCTKCQHTFRVRREGNEAVIVRPVDPGFPLPLEAPLRQDPPPPPAPAPAPMPMARAGEPDPFARFGESEDTGEHTRPGVFLEGINATMVPPAGPKPLEPSFQAQADLPSDVFDSPTRVTRIPVGFQQDGSRILDYQPPDITSSNVQLPTLPGTAAVASPAADANPFEAFAPFGANDPPSEPTVPVVSQPFNLPPDSNPFESFGAEPTFIKQPAPPQPPPPMPKPARAEPRTLPDAPAAVRRTVEDPPENLKTKLAITQPDPQLAELPELAEEPAMFRQPAPAPAPAPAAPAPAMDLDLGAFDAPPPTRQMPELLADVPPVPQSSAPAEDDFSLDAPSTTGGSDVRAQLFDMPAREEPEAAPPPEVTEPQAQALSPAPAPIPRPQPSAPAGGTALSMAQAFPRRRIGGVVLNVTIAAILVALISVVGTVYLNDGKLDANAFSPGRLKTLFFGQSSPLVALDISNGLYATKGGRAIFYVRGQVKNRGSAEATVKVRAEIYDGESLVRFSETWAGATPTPETLYNLTSAEQLDALGNDGNRSTVKPGTQEPFLVAFYEYPPQLEAFRVRVTVIEGPRPQTAARE